MTFRNDQRTKVVVKRGNDGEEGNRETYGDEVRDIGKTGDNLDGLDGKQTNKQYKGARARHCERLWQHQQHV